MLEIFTLPNKNIHSVRNLINTQKKSITFYKLNFGLVGKTLSINSFVT